MRLFIAILLTDQIKTYIDQNAKEINYFTSKGQMTDKDNYHITLRFLGETEETTLPDLQKAIQEATARSCSFELVLSGFGEFKKPGGSIIWLGLKEKTPALQSLYQDLENELLKADYPKETRNYSPHITLIRQARLTKPLSEIQTSFNNTTLDVKQIALMESCRIEGQLIYIPLALFPLK